MSLRSRLGFFKKTPVIFSMIILLLLLVVVPLLAIVFGLDQKLLPSQLEGYVRDSKGDAVASATIGIQGKTTVTDDKGYFSIGPLVYGSYDLTITANGFGTVTQNVHLQRLGNSENFTLGALEYGDVTVSFDLGGNPFYSNEFVAKLNDETLDVNDRFQISTGKVLVGNYLLNIVSPYYQDINQTLVVAPGSSSQKIKLVPAGDVVGEIKNWLTGDPLTPDKVEMKQDTVYVLLDDKSWDADHVTLADLAVGSKLTLRISKDGFNTLEQNIDIKQGINSLGELALSPQGKLLGLKDDGFNRTLYASDYDGRNPQQLFTTILDCNIVGQSTNRGVVRCGSGKYTLFSLDVSGPSILSTTDVAADSSSYDLWGARVLLIDNSKSSKLFQLQNGTLTSLYSGPDAVTSVQTSKSGAIVFTTAQNVWWMSSAASQPQILSNGTFTVASVSSDGQYSLLQNFTSGPANNIWLLNNQTQVKRKLTFLPAEYTDVQFTSNSTFIFRSIKNGSGELNTQNIGSDLSRVLLSGVYEVRVITDTDKLVVRTSQGMFMLSIASGQLAKITP